MSDKKKEPMKINETIPLSAVDYLPEIGIK